MGENNSKWSNWQTTNLKNIQATPTAQLQKNKAKIPPCRTWHWQCEGSKGANELGRTVMEIGGQLAVNQRSQNTTVNQEQQMKTEQKEAVEKFYNSEEREMIKGEVI